MPARHLTRLALAAGLFAVPLAAAAQTNGGATPQGEQPPKPGSAGTTGVIRPPRHVDPGIAHPPPPAVGHGADPMPVLRPPGAPGGNPNVIPK